MGQISAAYAVVRVWNTAKVQHRGRTQQRSKVNASPPHGTPQMTMPASNMLSELAKTGMNTEAIIATIAAMYTLL